MRSPRIFAILAVLIFAVLIWLYVREFEIFSKTLNIKGLVIGSMLVMAGLAGGLVWRWRDRFTPWDRHFPEVVLIMVFSVLFAPLFGSLLNRALGSKQNQSYEFISETAYFASGYGILKDQKLQPTGWRLRFRKGKHEYQIKYKTQAYFPLTKPGEPILLPVCVGLFGTVVTMNDEL